MRIGSSCVDPSDVVLGIELAGAASMVRSPRGVTFFACAKKVTKESTPQAARTPRFALRVRERSGNFRKAHPCAIRKRRPSGAAPFGFYPAHSPCLMGALKSHSKGVHSRSVRVGFRGPLKVRQSRRVKPAGRRTRMCAVFGRGRRPRPKILAGTAHPPRSGGRTAGGCFFCLLFFAQAKKSRAPAASGAMFEASERIRRRNVLRSWWVLMVSA